MIFFGFMPGVNTEAANQECLRSPTKKDVCCESATNVTLALEASQLAQVLKDDMGLGGARGVSEA